MKKIILVLCTSMLIITYAVAQVPADTLRNHLEHKGMYLENQYGTWLEDMQIPDSQRNQMHAWDRDYWERREGIYNNMDLSTDETRKRIEALDVENRQRFVDKLNADQWAKYETYNRDRTSWRNRFSSDSAWLNDMQSALSLSDDQVTKLGYHRQHYNDKLADIRSNNNLSEGEMRTQIKQLNADKKESISRVLDMDQIKKLDMDENGDLKIKGVSGNKKIKVKVKEQ